MAALMTANEITEPEDPGDVVKLKPGAHYTSHNREIDSPMNDTDHQSQRDGSANVQSERTKQQVNGSIKSQNGSSLESQVVVSHAPGEKGFEDSTTALLRRYTAERNGRPTSIHLTSKGEIDGASSLMDTFRVVGKLYTVTLDEEQLSWVATGKKDAKKEILYLSDIFSVTHGQPSSHPPPPTRPQSSSSSHPKRNHAPSQALDFTVFALKSLPGTVGHPVKVTFKGQSADTCQLWAEQIGHQMMNFGNRPRKLFVVINPASGDNPAGAERIWRRVLRMFEMAQIHTDVLYTQHRFHAREHIQSLDLAQYDGLVAVGGDGIFNEVLNGVMIMTQQQSGVNLRHPRFIPVTPTIRLGVIPIGFTNSIARSLFGSKSPMVAAAQIMLGCSSPVDICSVTQNNQLLLFSAGPMAYGFWSDTALFSHDFSWLGTKRLEVAMIRTLVSLKHFEAELSFIPVTEEAGQEEEESLSGTRERKCFNRCPMCSHFDVSDASPSAKHEKGASIMAGSEVDRIDDRKWKKFSGHFSSVMVCPNICSTSQAPHGSSPFSHMGNGCLDLVVLTRCSRFEHAKWLFKQRRGTQLDHPHVHVRQVKEFKFREILKPTRNVRGASHDNEDNMDVNSVDNLVQEVDDDEATNSRAGRSNQTSREGSGVAMPTSSWNIDGDEIPKADIDIRVHRHLLAIFARGPEPFDSEATSLSTSHSSEDIERTSRDDLIPEAANT